MVRIGITCEVEISPNENKFYVISKYIEAIYGQGAVPVVIPASISTKYVDEYANMIDGFLVPGGLDVKPKLYNEDPHIKVDMVDEIKDIFEIELIRKMAEQGKPVFGICRGLQVINVAFGGTLIQDIPSYNKECMCHCQDDRIRYELTHKVKSVKDSLINKLLGDEFFVNSYHHQSVKDLGQGLVCTGKSNDGIIETIEHESYNIFGVQWHPEELYQVHREFEKLFEAFVNMAKEYKNKI